MNIRNFLKHNSTEFSIYIVAGILILSAYFIIAKLMPIVLSCKVMLD